MRINVKNGRKWVRALRSGEYVQGKGQLMTPESDGKGGRHCCLGVATDLYDPEHLEERYSDASLPSEVMRWLGVSDHNPSLILERLPFSSRLMADAATTLNDELDYSFEQIANAIERTWPEVKLQKNRTKAERELVKELDAKGEINWGKKA